MLRVEDWDIDQWVADLLENYEKYLDRLLGAPPTEDELVFEGQLGHLDEDLWRRLGWIVGEGE